LKEAAETLEDDSSLASGASIIQSNDQTIDATPGRTSAAQEKHTADVSYVNPKP
jgi:hypothetical protein